MKTAATGRLRTLAGVMLKDAFRYERALRSPDERAWLRLCNRCERLEHSGESEGVACLWQGSSPLHAPTVIPAWGRRLMHRALSAHPVDLCDQAPPAGSGKPEISFVIVHRGLTRLPLLLTTLKSVAAQADVSLECLVVEDADQPEIQQALPQWVRYVHRRPPQPGAAFNRAGAFNAGVAVARADVVVLHDNDLLAPADYASKALQLVKQGYEVVNHKRFIFYLSESATGSLIDANPQKVAATIPVTVLQNATGGGSIVMTLEAFHAVGGLDDEFVGWGGEDTEFWPRALTRRTWRYGFLPLIHLWHAPQPGKTPEKQTPGMERLNQLERVDVEQRIHRLRARQAEDLGAAEQE